MNQKITGFHKDEENHWVADLGCGHAQHVRHDPPWIDRPWTQTLEGRNSRLGMELDCVRCDELGAAVAGISGLCAEGHWDVTMDSLRALDLKPSIVSALRPKTS